MIWDLPSGSLIHKGYTMIMLTIVHLYNINIINYSYIIPNKPLLTIVI